MFLLQARLAEFVRVESEVALLGNDDFLATLDTWGLPECGLSFAQLSQKCKVAPRSNLGFIEQVALQLALVMSECFHRWYFTPTLQGFNGTNSPTCYQLSHVWEISSFQCATQ